MASDKGARARTKLERLAEERRIESDEKLRAIFPTFAESRIESGSGYVERGRATTAPHLNKVTRVKRVTKGVSCREIEAMIHAQGLMVPELYAFSDHYMVIEDVGRLTLDGYRSLVRNKAKAFVDPRASSFLEAQGKKLSSILYKVLVQLEKLHARGIYHLDFSSDNVVLGFPEGVDALDVPVEQVGVYIIDFGSARFASGVDLEVGPDGIAVPPGGELVAQPTLVHPAEYDSFSLMARSFGSMKLGNGNINGILHDRFAFATVTARVYGVYVGATRQPYGRPSHMPIDLYELARQLTSPLANKRLSPDAKLQHHPWAKTEAAKLRKGVRTRGSMAANLAAQDVENKTRGVTQGCEKLETLSGLIARGGSNPNLEEELKPWILGRITGKAPGAKLPDSDQTLVTKGPLGAALPRPQVTGGANETHARKNTRWKNDQHLVPIKGWINMGTSSPENTPAQTCHRTTEENKIRKPAQIYRQNTGGAGYSEAIVQRDITCERSATCRLPSLELDLIKADFSARLHLRPGNKSCAPATGESLRTRLQPEPSSGYGSSRSSTGVKFKNTDKADFTARASRTKAKQYPVKASPLAHKNPATPEKCGYARTCKNDSDGKGCYKNEAYRTKSIGHGAPARASGEAKYGKTTKDGQLISDEGGTRRGILLSRPRKRVKGQEPGISDPPMVGKGRVVPARASAVEAMDTSRTPNYAMSL